MSRVYARWTSSAAERIKLYDCYASCKIENMTSSTVSATMSIYDSLCGPLPQCQTMLLSERTKAKFYARCNMLILLHSNL